MSATHTSYHNNNKTHSNSKAAHVIADVHHPPESSAVLFSNDLIFKANQPRQKFQDLLRKHKENFDVALAKRALHFKDVKATLLAAEWKERTDGNTLDDKLSLLKTELEVLKKAESAKVVQAKEEVWRQREKNRLLKENRTAVHDSLLIRRAFVLSVHGENTLPLPSNPLETTTDTTNTNCTSVWDESAQLFSETQEDANNNNEHNN